MKTLFFKILITIIGLIYFISILLGFSNILEFIGLKNSGGFLSLMLTGCSAAFIGITSMKEEQQKKTKLLNIAKHIYCLDYTNLNNISKIDFDSNFNLKVHLKNGLKLNLPTCDIPKTQEELKKLDNNIIEP